MKTRKPINDQIEKVMRWKLLLFFKYQMDSGAENTINEVKDEIESVNSRIDKAKESVNSRL